MSELSNSEGATLCDSWQVATGLQLTIVFIFESSTYYFHD